MFKTQALKDEAIKRVIANLSADTLIENLYYCMGMKCSLGAMMDRPSFHTIQHITKKYGLESGVALNIAKMSDALARAQARDSLHAWPLRQDLLDYMENIDVLA